MKFLSRPKQKVWTRRVTCSCKAVLEVEAKDFRIVADQRDGDAAVCKCPVCRSEIWINLSLIPYRVQQLLSRRR